MTTNTDLRLDDHLSVAQAAKSADLTESQIRDVLRSGRLPVTRVGPRCVLISPLDLAVPIRSQPVSRRTYYGTCLLNGKHRPGSPEERECPLRNAVARSSGPRRRLQRAGRGQEVPCPGAYRRGGSGSHVGLVQARGALRKGDVRGFNGE